MRHLALFLTASAMTMAVPSVAAARSRSGPAFITAGVVADPPVGYVEMCRANPVFCGQLEGRDAADVALSLDAMDLSATALPAVSQTDATPAATASISARLGPAFSAHMFARIRQARRSDDDIAPLQTPAHLFIAPIPVQPASVEMTRKGLVAFNNMVNRAVIQRTDYQIYGVAERWSRPIGAIKAVGDCEDIAIEKRARLVEGGVDPRALSLAVVYSRFRGLHTVLVAHLADGDFVLDSLSAKVRRWADTDYIWLRIQSRDNPGTWYSVGSTYVRRAPVGGYFGREDSQGAEG